jgi:hypothetical protein
MWKWLEKRMRSGCGVFSDIDLPRIGAAPRVCRPVGSVSAEIETRLWSMENVVRLMEAREDIRSGALLVG